MLERFRIKFTENVPHENVPHDPGPVNESRHFCRGVAKIFQREIILP